MREFRIGITVSVARTTAHFDDPLTHVLFWRNFMRIAIVGVGLAALALAGCSSSTPTAPTNPTPTATTAPSPTAATLGAPALGDGGRIAVALKDNTVATIVTVNPDGSDLKKLTDGKTFDGCPDLGPGGTFIA